GFVTDLHAYVFHPADEFFRLRFLGELVDVFAVAILVFEGVAVFQRGHELRGMRDPGDLAADDAAVDRGPALSSLFVVTPAPAADVDGAPAQDEVERPLEGLVPVAEVMEPVLPRDGRDCGHGWKCSTGGGNNRDLAAKQMRGFFPFTPFRVRMTTVTVVRRTNTEILTLRIRMTIQWRAMTAA